MRVLLTGGAGYIGSHTCIELIERGHDVVILDNFCNSTPKVIERIARICGKRPLFLEADIRDTPTVLQALQHHDIEAVIHFAALKAVGESQSVPLEYFDNNISGTLSLLKAMKTSGIRPLVFSSSATVYGEAPQQPVDEASPLGSSNPYGRTKLVCEQLIGDIASANGGILPAILRYFNPVGAHKSGLIGELPIGVPNNLLPFVSQTAAGQHPYVRVFGNDYPTRDGTGIRDYIHVTDLAIAHIRALEYLISQEKALTVNLGTGHGYSVLEIIDTFQRISGRHIRMRVCPRRPGDVATCYAAPALAEKLLGWRAQHNLEQMCADAWRWQQQLDEQT
ncbi:UDP-glucose 4-epimerase GalE [Lysobacter pythonis]|uniref:UDP-glucose 4-epimerase n=1 Tax=Solilutibacter pythonis TaxID=2483112 RepID=A0A3M2HUF9_9GAMM|nr:UDP-glucose 4-epimerase GalE [Lysobacter pythonis]RMH93341.1 UDP-glucose 4-epimerase GalE [Lysobacter pythonis]